MNEILLVEADPATLTLRADELLADGHDVNTANSAAAARVKLPTASGLILGHLDTAPETLALLRELRGGQIPHADPAIPVITIGADHDHELIRHYQAGADISLPTTASPTLINATVHALTARAARHAAAAARAARRRPADRSKRSHRDCRRRARAVHQSRVRAAEHTRRATQPSRASQGAARASLGLRRNARQDQRHAPRADPRKAARRRIHRRNSGRSRLRAPPLAGPAAASRPTPRGAATPERLARATARTMNRAPVTTRCTTVTTQQRSSRR